MYILNSANADDEEMKSENDDISFIVQTHRPFRQQPYNCFDDLSQLSKRSWKTTQERMESGIDREVFDIDDSVMNNYEQFKDDSRAAVAEDDIVIGLQESSICSSSRNSSRNAMVIETPEKSVHSSLMSCCSSNNKKKEHPTDNKATMLVDTGEEEDEDKEGEIYASIDGIDGDVNTDDIDTGNDRVQYGSMDIVSDSSGKKFTTSQHENYE
jgi:hypothetical protein